ncbi:MAG: zinc-ribbon domain-containing protein [Candidatus Accumulibacter sp.]|jgi:predicted Zn finger-like uncharacterized protein|nr:zinc-ribbon domain-containing protein [Accumulibacter sp.]
MKTRCPDCQTVFRITPDQIKARAGRVRCGHCQTVFDALDNLLGEQRSAPVPASGDDGGDTQTRSASVSVAVKPEVPPTPREFPFSADAPDKTVETAEETEEADDQEAGIAGTNEQPLQTPSDPGQIRQAGLAAKLILPRETIEIPGYSKWAEGIMAPPFDAAAETPSRWPFMLAAVVLALTLAGQALFQFRGELAVSLPGLRPALETLSLALDSPLPLPRHTDLVSIETSDLQTDSARGNLLILNTTLRNKAPYGQAYPSLELSLTDTQDTVIARRVLAPPDYLPAKAAVSSAFAGNADLAVRLWIEAVNLNAAGYRLLVFYP